MKTLSFFLVGLVCGMVFLLQAQDAAYQIEADCLNDAQHNGTLTKSSCKQESAWIEKIT